MPETAHAPQLGYALKRRGLSEDKLCLPLDWSSSRTGHVSISLGPSEDRLSLRAGLPKDKAMSSFSTNCSCVSGYQTQFQEFLQKAHL